MVDLSSHSLTIPASPQPVSGASGFRSGAKKKLVKINVVPFSSTIFVTSNHHLMASILSKIYNICTLISTSAIALGGGIGGGGGGDGAGAAFFVDKPSACVRKSPSLV